MLLWRPPRFCMTPVAALMGGAPPAITIDPPVLTLTSSATNPPQYDAVFSGPPNATQAGDTARITWAYNSGFTGATTEDEVLDTELLSGNLAGAFPLWDAGLTPGQTVYWKTKVLRNPGAGNEIDSGWSNTLNAVVPVTVGITWNAFRQYSPNATSASISSVAFGAGIRIVCILNGSLRSVTSVTSSGGETFVKAEEVGADILEMWYSTTEPAAATETITVNFSGVAVDVDIDCLTGSALDGASLADSATNAWGGGVANPQTFDNTLVVPASGMGLAYVFAAGTDVHPIVSTNGTILHQRDRGGADSLVGFITYPAGTVTPSYTPTGTNADGGGVAGAWNPA